jgi:hypothetical protein
MRKREFAMRMRKCEKAIDRCDAITLKNLANAMRMRKLIRITSPVYHYEKKKKRIGINFITVTVSQ